MNATEIIPNLWMGGEIVPALPDEYDAVMGLRWEAEDYALPLRRQKRLKQFAWVPMVDGPVLPDPVNLGTAVRLVDEWSSNGWKVLVHCGEGKNRSGLVVALALIRRFHAPQEAIDLIRSKRPGALNNQAFVTFILNSAGSLE